MRIVILDLPESRKNEREALRYLLKKQDSPALKILSDLPLPYMNIFLQISKKIWA